MLHRRENRIDHSRKTCADLGEEHHSFRVTESGGDRPKASAISRRAREPTDQPICPMSCGRSPIFSSPFSFVPKIHRWRLFRSGPSLRAAVRSARRAASRWRPRAPQGRHSRRQQGSMSAFSSAPPFAVILTPKANARMLPAFLRVNVNTRERDGMWSIASTAIEWTANAKQLHIAMACLMRSARSNGQEATCDSRASRRGVFPHHLVMKSP